MNRSSKEGSGDIKANIKGKSNHTEDKEQIRIRQGRMMKKKNRGKTGSKSTRRIKREEN